MTPVNAPHASGDVAQFSPLEEEAPRRWAQRLNLVPEHGISSVLRALLLALIAWVPIVAWALFSGQEAGIAPGESVLRHYGVHVRCLVFIPLLVLAQPLLHLVALRLSRQLALLSSESTELHDRIAAVNGSMQRLGRASLPWLLIGGATIGWMFAEPPRVGEDYLAWAVDRDGGLGFGGLWYVYAVRPLCIVLLLAWLWRIALMTLWTWRMSRIGLPLAPVHPDRAGGLGFFEELPEAFMLVSFACSALVAGRWAHEIQQHGAQLRALQFEAGAIVLLLSLLLLLPQLALTPLLFRTRREALLRYSALVGRHGRLLHRRWIDGLPAGDEPILDAPEIGPSADIATLYDAVRSMRWMLVGWTSLVKVVVPPVLPFLALTATQIPVREMLLRVLKLLA